ncbi:sugar phosphate isomerase/epimerase [Niveispirillum sp.]|uniref:sugar phosphate isomerase/epimerase family protein n=1 Tax=Niveispirillum sp. TaxID=1917217 RepID=UPI001B5931BF|nr:sugar phosphate isomerase/epimerase [Niveispirillum sp.]MBP7338487.1 sugar phosphate isomerase/epimerase [Niveispirillum sp.]
MPRLLILQSVWGMDKCPGFDVWNDLETALQAIVDAGFDGAGTNLVRKERTAVTSRFMNERGLAWEAQVLARTADELDRFAEEAAALSAHHLNVQIAGPLDRVADAVRLVESMERVRERAGLPILYETHRARLTQDLPFFLRMLDALPFLPLTADLCHYVVAGEWELPVDGARQAGIDRILRQAKAFHGRVATAHQVQAPIGGHHQPWLDLFLDWWKRGFQQWRQQSQPQDSLSFMVELGPPPYAVVDTAGRELTDRWQEAKRLKDLVRALWT